jgi:D-arabinose 1-dehydrogenase-like Zn-dependent alcohol dehydrogenase
MSNDTFHGWAATGKGLPLQWTELALKEFDEDTIEMDISHCGICGSDIHTMDSGWYLYFFFNYGSFKNDINNNNNKKSI